LPTLFAVWLAAALVLYLVPTAVGHNLLRSSIFLFPLMLLASTLRSHRPRWLALTATVASLCAAVLPYASMVEARVGDPLSTRGAWTGTLAYLRAHSGPDFRVEVVPTANHWEAYYVAGAGFAIARGWYRQLDIADDRPLYAATLTGPAYRAWLRREGVRYVVLPIGPYEAIDGTREAELLVSGRAGLRRVWVGRYAGIYELEQPTPLITGPGVATVTRMSSGIVEGRASRPGRYLVRLHWTTDWRISRGAGCVAPAAHGLTELVLRRPGAFALGASQEPFVFLDRLLDGPPRCGATR
jgi:hypothetical protein